MFTRRRIQRKGAPATARVLRVVEDAGPMANTYRAYVHDVQVEPADGAPFAATIRHKFDITDPRPRVGTVLDVRYDPKTLEAVFVLDGDPRYDPDAMNARSEAIFASLPDHGR